MCLAAKRAQMDEARLKARQARMTNSPGPGAYDVKKMNNTAAEVC